MPRVFLNRSVQIRTKSWRDIDQVIFSQVLRVRQEITGTIGRDDFGVSQGAKSAHTGSMEAMSDAGGAQKRPALRGGPLAWGGVAPLGHQAPLGSLVAPCPDHKSGPPNCPGYFVTDP